MLKSHMFSGDHRRLAISPKARHVSGDSRELPSSLSCSNSIIWKKTIGIRSMQTCSSSVIVHANHEGKPEVSETEDVNTFERPRIRGSREMATEATWGILRMVSESDERCNELAQVVVECNEVNVEANGARAREIHEDLSYKEMMERWEFLKHLPHQFLRDIGYTIAGPSLLSTSKELPIVNPSTLGGSNNQWPDTKAWLEQLSIPAVEAWFASHRSSQRLGDHFALCIEYVLRHSPQVEVQHLITSQQVVQRLTEPVRNSSKALKALQEKLVAQRDVSDENMLRPCLLPEQQHVSSERASTDSVDENIQLLKSMDLGGGPLQERIGKRKRKLLKKLERIRLRKGKTNTIGEFDYLFETQALANDGSRGKELQHWEVSVKFLLYAGPWEVFGLKSPKSAAWSKPDSDWKRGPFEGSIDNAGTSTTTVEESNGLHSQDEVDAFLGCYLGPHVGETLFDRKTRLRNQLALSANPCAALLLQDLYRNKGNLNKLRNSEFDLVEEEGTSSPMEDLDGGGNNAGEEFELDLYRNKGTRNKLRNDIVEKEGIGTPQEDLDGGGNSNSKESQHVSVVPSALLKGYLFYEYKLWCFLESAPTPSVPDNEPSEKASLNVSHWMGWWTRDIMEFANLPRHQHSNWYIVPKLEWLSPVVIPSSDPDRCARVLCLSDFVLTAAQVAEEAARLQMPRKRRFLVAELRWDESVSSTRGAWLEVSRGFVVEDTWPDSKMYKAHGYWVSWAPSGRVPIHCRRHLDPVDVTVDV